MKQVLDGEKGEHLRVVDGLITSQGKVFVSAESPTLPSLLAHAHGCGHEGIEKVLHRLCAEFHAHGCGHEGIEKALHRLRAEFQVPGAREAVRDFMRACLTCQHNKTEQLQPAGLLQTLLVPSTVWADIAIDFIEGLPKVNGRSY
jgi:hypothetical protein